jgi:DNA polymerase III subunit gamma/tau
VPKILSLSTRPRSLSGLYGQAATVAAIRKHQATRPPQTWMFTGPSGTGKTTLAWIMAISYQCQHMKLWGDPCAACWENREEWAIHEVNASSERGVDEMEKIVEMSRYKPAHEGGKRVIILDEMQGVSASGQRLLLKPTENPPATTVWIICTTDPSKLLPTLRGRCVTYQMRALGIADAEKFLTVKAEKAGIARPLQPLFEQCHLLGASAPRVLLQALEKYAAGASALDAVAGTEGAVDSLRVCKAVTSGDWKALCAALKEANPDEARLIRASVSGWLKGCLAREANPQGQEKAAVGLVELSAPPLDDAAMMQWLWGALWKICRRYQR